MYKHYRPPVKGDYAGSVEEVAALFDSFQKYSLHRYIDKPCLSIVIRKERIALV
jgi:hypothetical protein